MLHPDTQQPPAAPRRPTAHIAHGDTRLDDWQWLANRDDPQVIAYLEDENAYTDAVLSPTVALQDQLFQQIRGRVAETDVSTPFFHNGWWRWSRLVAGQQYPVHCRRADPSKALSTAEVLAAARAALPGAGVAGDGTPAPAGNDLAKAISPNAGEVVLDENRLAGSSEYFAVGVYDVRPDQEVLAYAVDHDGAERYRLRFRDLGSGDDLADVIEDVYYGSAWSGSGNSFYYVRPDKAMRPWQVWRHLLGTPAVRDQLVFQEDDERFFVSVQLTRSNCFVLVTSGSKMSTEVRYLRADKDRGDFSVVLPRRDGVEYDVEHAIRPEAGDVWLVRTNEGPDDEKLENFGLFELRVGQHNTSQMRPLVPYRPEVKVESVDAFARHVLVSERADGLEQLRVVRLSDGEEHLVAQPDPAYKLSGDAGFEWDTDVARFGYSSLVHPTSSIEYDMETRARVTVKDATVGGGYKPGDYRSERIWAVAPDGTRVPVSLVCRREQALDGSAPCLLYGYGSYEHSIDPSFSYTRLNLLERGFVFAIAHVRGGGELGRPWYEQGRLMHKRNTFTDFIACADLLVAEGWTSPDRLTIRGGSAGGLLMGAVTNMRPDLFKAVVAEVPFVDVVTTMTDETLPLTVTEWEEWGNPRDDAEAYNYMKSYSPYDNVHVAEYPSIYATAGLNDPRVGYWEPAKWVAKLRATKTGDGTLLLRTEMGAGHSGPSGRYDSWRDEARVHSFILASLNVES